MNIPKLTSFETAIKIYYSHSEMGNKEITELFGKMSSSTVQKLKSAVKKEMISREVKSYGMYRVNTEIAYEVWGINIDDLVRRVKTLRELGL